LKYCLIKENEQLYLVEIAQTHMYQFTALIFRLHKEIEKLTVHADSIPILPEVLLECSNADVSSSLVNVVNGLEYINGLEKRFAILKDENYPVISLLTEIRAFQAQLEFLFEEDED
jgi:hypothetical protein